VRKAIASGFLAFLWIDGKTNPADILSKHWDYVSVHPMLTSLLFWQGETKNLKDITKTDKQHDSGKGE
jgi:hypothetical protein